MNTDIKARQVLELAHAAWVRLEETRARRRRYTRYTYGDQWSDIVRDRKGNPITEREQLTVGGREPLGNNLIRRMVKAVVGRYRMGIDQQRGAADNNPPGAPATNATASGEGADAALDRWRRFNGLDELDARTLEEFLISGMAIHRVWAERRPAGDGIWVDNVSPDRFFINAVRDSRATDTELIGHLLDMSLAELTMRFAHGDRNRAAALQALYASMESAGPVFATDSIASGGETFFHAPQGRCRVVEVWTLEWRELLRCHDPLEATFTLVAGNRAAEIERLNNRRRRTRLPPVITTPEAAAVWHCRMLAPDGTVLSEFDSPLPGGSHPFALKLYPMVDGNVHSLVEDVIDQQRYVNRLITLMDRMMGTAAKGVLLFPTGCKVEGQSWEKLSEKWSDPGGVIPYRPFHGAEPHQVVTPMADFGAGELLKTQISLFEDVSGVSDALMGKSVSGVVGVDRYESEVRNASVAVNDLLKTFADFTHRRDTLIKAWNPAG